MGPFNNDTKRIVLRLLWNNNIVRVCEQYRDERYIHSDDDIAMRISGIPYNWRNLQLVRKDWHVWNKHNKMVGRLPKHY